MKVISFLLLLSACATKQEIDPIRATFLSKDFVYRQCFYESDSYRGRHTDEKRSVDVSFLIEKNGLASDIKILRSDFKDPNLHSCLISMIKRLRFEENTLTTVSTQTINFDQAQL